AATWRRVSAERACLAALRGSCTTPVAVLADELGSGLRLRALLVLPDGSQPLFLEQVGDEAEALGSAVGAELRGRAGPAHLARPAAEGERSRRAFAAAGHEVLLAPVLAIEALPAPLDLTGIQALAVTSRQGAAALARATPRRDLPVYAVGDATAEQARAAGFA